MLTIYLPKHFDSKVFWKASKNIYQKISFWLLKITKTHGQKCFKLSNPNQPHSLKVTILNSFLCGTQKYFMHMYTRVHTLSLKQTHTHKGKPIIVLHTYILLFNFIYFRALSIPAHTEHFTIAQNVEPTNYSTNSLSTKLVNVPSFEIAVPLLGISNMQVFNDMKAYNDKCTYMLTKAFFIAIRNWRQ